MKTKEELNALKEEVETVNSKLRALTEEEMAQVCGGNSTKKVIATVKLLLPGGNATSSPPVGPALTQYGINIPAFLNEFNTRTKNDKGLIIPTIITVYADHSFTFIVKTPPAPVMLKKELGL